MTATIPPLAGTPSLAETAPKVLSLLAGYVGHRAVSIGLRTQLIRTLADRPGSTADDLAEACGLDPFYVGVWGRAALGAGVVRLERGDLVIVEGELHLRLRARRRIPGGSGRAGRALGIGRGHGLILPD